MNNVPQPILGTVVPSTYDLNRVLSGVLIKFKVVNDAEIYIPIAMIAGVKDNKTDGIKNYSSSYKLVFYNIERNVTKEVHWSLKEIESVYVAACDKTLQNKFYDFNEFFMFELL